ncbi:Crp/Fnr family transcriptional regulator [Sediminibacterium salmoneum]|uniref:Crp/Fnr family transcriptional regulator n=1 Tax=Sediminibacterium salmoneum TaxID=426421 RepID=UPI00047DAA37|nr:Crp/Fnr family transcriptional regulator [Sediminibacterium salmoneum]
MISPEFLYVNISEKQSAYFLSVIERIGKPRIVKKGEVLIREGKCSTFFFYIKSGAFKTSIVRNDKSYILGFTLNGDIDCCPSSLLKNIKNNFSIEAISDSDVLICDFKDFKNICSPEKFNSITNNIMANYIRILENRVIEAISLTAEDRYNYLLENNPLIIKSIPLSLIASYLGITKERLSRIRRSYKS